MRIIEKLKMTEDEFKKNGAINIVALGDSVTHGCFSADEFDYEATYWSVLRKKINKVKPSMPVNAINSGQGATTAPHAAERLERDVLSYHPDLVIVCFGLNDVNFPLEDFKKALETIFTKCKENSDVIYLSPNMMNSYVHEKTNPRHVNYAHTTAQYQTSGKMDLYVDEAKKIAEKCGVLVCDGYGAMKKMGEEGKDTTELLSNYVNHPIREIHALWADMLFDIIFKDSDISDTTFSGVINK